MFARIGIASAALLTAGSMVAVAGAVPPHPAAPTVSAPDNRIPDAGHPPDSAAGIDNRVSSLERRAKVLETRDRLDNQPIAWLAIILSLAGMMLSIAAILLWWRRPRHPATHGNGDIHHSVPRPVEAARARNVNTLKANSSLKPSSNDKKSEDGFSGPAQPSHALPPLSQPEPVMSEQPRGAVKKRRSSNTATQIGVGKQAPPSHKSDVDDQLSAIMDAFDRFASVTVPVFSDYLEQLGEARLRDVTVIGDDIVVGTAFSRGMPGVLLTGIVLDDGSYAVAPSFYFVKEFGMLFHQELDTAAEVRALFEVVADGRQHLHCDQPALVVSNGGKYECRAYGRLSGFTPRP